MTSITRRTLSVLLASALAFSALPAAAEKAKVMRLGWTTSDGADDPYAIGARLFKELVETRSEGRIEVQLYPNRQLGEEKQMVDGMRMGTVDAGIITNPAIGQIAPSFQLNDLPFLFASEDAASRVLDGETGAKLAEDLQGKGIRVLGFMEGGFRHMVNNTRPVAKPADVQGIKFRVQQNPVFIGMFNALGGNAVPMAWGETYTAVQQGAIDGLEAPLAVIEQNKYPEVVKYLSLTNHTYSAIPLLVSNRFWNALPDDLKTIVSEAGTEATLKQREQTRAVALGLKDKLATQGMSINEVEDLAAFRALVGDVYENFRASIGSELMDMALEASK